MLIDKSLINTDQLQRELSDQSIEAMILVVFNLKQNNKL